ncbi:MAG: enoyl-CoA hydratase-related protein, partial [Actinomycetota bacterium]|nr:enoyl-CoA hydratase-related protein [Actinomycetota bacterium]
MPLVTVDNGPAEGVRVLTLNDPDRRNAMSPALQADLGAAVDAIIADRDARVLVVTGAGSAFSAGADLPAVFGGLDRHISEIREGLRAIYD